MTSRRLREPIVPLLSRHILPRTTPDHPERTSGTATNHAVSKRGPFRLELTRPDRQATDEY